MRYFGIPNENGDFVRDFVGMNFNVSDSVVSYEDDSIRLKAEWQASENFGLQAELYQLTSDRMWKNAEAYFLTAPDELERWDPLMIGHDMEHTGLRTNLSFSSSGDGVRASVGFEMNDVIVRPSHELLHSGESDRHHLRRVRRRRPDQLRARRSRGHHDGAVLAGQFVGLGSVGGIRRSAVQFERPLVHRGRAAHGRLRHADRAARPGRRRSASGRRYGPHRPRLRSIRRHGAVWSIRHRLAASERLGRDRAPSSIKRRK